MAVGGHMERVWARWRALGGRPLLTSLPKTRPSGHGKDLVGGLGWEKQPLHPPTSVTLPDPRPLSAQDDQSSASPISSWGEQSTNHYRWKS
ncbi:hypothetical protein Pcinc_018698 [Petrolisthes cinctipes]|uniref:Uncharacterized protein n=1 Tax=Petrolisthes cinctipes TaxID=88211 RepID=A0AAE1BFS9_PETCI|nr:hypothetical protein Pcinc_043489 [Petrolisthes cinctipes]KAK3876524.1 hypothetical protein Pcinc_018698 [Petrolisthes cinctipes]